MNIPKDDAKSILHRKLGDSHYDKLTHEEFLKALKFYNKAICFAPNDSENLCIAYARRSAVYFNLFMFEECLENIKLANDINKCSLNLQAELEKRKTECKVIMSVNDPNADGVWNEPELSYPPHEKCPHVANCLDVRVNKQFGNHVVTNRDLKVGEIVGILKPFCTTQTDRYQYERCENCCMEHSQNLLPCRSCTVVMFCDENCMKEAMEGFHKYECSVIDLINLTISKHQTKLTLRVVMRGLAIFNGDIDKLLDATEKGFKKNVTIFDIDHQNERDQCAAIASLKKVTKPDNPAIVDTEVSNLSTVCEYILTASNIVSKKKPQEFKKTLKHVLKQHLLMVIINGRLFDDFSTLFVNRSSLSPDDIEKMDSNMSGIFPFVELMPHSCIPNVMCSSSTNKEIVSILRPVRAGEPLFISLTGTYLEMPRDERRKKMKFQCHCIACQNDYPTMENLRSGIISIPAHIAGALENIRKWERQKSLDDYQFVVDCLQNNDVHTPCLELASMLRYYAIIMKIIYCKETCIGMRVNPVESPSDT